MIKTLLYFSFLLLASCQSLLNEGQDLYNKGLYSEALQKLEQAEREDPHDTEVKLWLAKARQAYIDRKLIEVRFLRQGENHDSALEKLEDILRKQAVWSIRYNSAISSTQETEIKEANKYLYDKIKSSFNKGKPTVIRWIEQEYEKTLSGGEAKKLLDFLQPKMLVQGQKKCKELKTTVGPQDFFYAESVTDFCELWGENDKIILDQTDPTRCYDLSFTDKIANLSSGEIQISGLKQKLKEAFSRSLFYSNYGTTKINTTLEGSIDYSRKSYLVSRIAYYQEPYTAYETKTEPIYDNLGTGGPKYKTTHVPVTKYKRVAYPYQVLKYDETLKIGITTKTNLLNQSFSLSEDMDESNSTESSSLSFPKASLYPKNPKFLDLSSLVEDFGNEMETRFSQSLQNYWETLYCSSKERNLVSKNEKIHRCERIKKNSIQVINWYHHHIGLTPAQYEQVLRRRAH